MVYCDVREALLGLVILGGCAGGSSDVETDEDVMMDLPLSDLPPTPCEFESRTFPEAEPGRCSGRTEAQCEAEGCWPVYGHRVDICTTAGATCDPERVFLGCGQISLCKDDGFVCSEDGQSVYAVGRRCLPPTGWTACLPAGVESRDSLYEPGCAPQ